MSFRKTLYLTTFSRDDPESSRTFFRFPSDSLCPESDPTQRCSESGEPTHSRRLDLTHSNLPAAEHETWDLDSRACESKLSMQGTASSITLTVVRLEGELGGADGFLGHGVRL
jgi:hypothetical protein